jgi:ubiquinone/menaquinone biosynthesis C-methylase UbiE
MTDPVSQAEIDAASAYEALFVPALFGDWAPIVAHAAEIKPGERVLDVACGSGILSREAASHVGATGRVAGVDPSPGMLSVAERLAPTVEWRRGTAESLPFPDQCFDAVVSQFGLMFFTDRLQALREMLRVLSPQGRLAVAVWDSLDRIPAYASEVALLERLAGQRAADALRAPFVLGDTKSLTSLFESAGFDSVKLTTRHGTARFPSIRTMVEADLRGWLPVMGVVLTEEQIQGVLAEAEDTLRAYVTSDGTVAFSIPAHIVTGRKA